ncbi:uncharacterized protein TRUGW13939_10843 [Talaromyces rugulosus]|uniref:F-box domain-containing protein n=1 Tax=Talaromyces rugulosus TaxID=121627 RepID=A0A7H8RB70_TALRU|nr:uncharacterized protein TRUGW13939_10843 [Talaromyces rugulosus]QKX63672.1 hypothetical protein TRUGW13939_10843 [Talaromyces rugulosus]
MHFLKKLRSPPRVTTANAGNKTFAASSASNKSTSSIDSTRLVPDTVISHILSYVCPHALDTSYKSSEESMTEDGCMLCDMRDLAHCVAACKRWKGPAQKLLYQNIRLDAVHYCELEIELSSKRKRRSFVGTTGKAIDVVQMRLLLFMKTVRESSHLADLVLSLRLPYMTREASKADLARTVSVLHHLRYVDLPAGFYSDDVSSYTLKQELMARCPEIRHMTYAHGSEGSFSRIPGSGLWGSLEVLELSDLHIDESTLRLVLDSFKALKSLKMESLSAVTDSVFASTHSLPPFPPLETMVLRNMPHLTATGLATYLTLPTNRDSLKNLTLTQTGILPEELHVLVSKASRLVSLTLEATVDRSFPVVDVPFLVSNSVHKLNYEISSANGSYGAQPVSGSYYKYLLASLMSRSLPKLRELYVLDPHFADKLLFAPFQQLSLRDETTSQPASQGLSQPLSLFSKGIDEMDWNLTQIGPTSPQASQLSSPSTSSSGRGSSATRPVSFHAAQLSPVWGGEARRSVAVGNGFGGFLAVPVDEERPRSSSGGGYKRQSKYDMWR